MKQNSQLQSASKGSSTGTVSESLPCPGQSRQLLLQALRGGFYLSFKIFYLFIWLCRISAVAGAFFDLRCCMLDLSFFFNCGMWDPVP